MSTPVEGMAAVDVRVWHDLLTDMHVAHMQFFYSFQHDNLGCNT